MLAAGCSSWGGPDKLQRLRWAIAIACAVVAALVSFGAPVDCLADEPTATPDAGAVEGGERVVVAVAANEQEAEAIVDALRELMARLGLQLAATRADALPWSRNDEPNDPSGQRTRARVWIDARPLDRVDLTVWTARKGAWDPPVSRSVTRAEATEAILVERVAHVVHATLESLLAQPAGDVPAPPAPQPPATAAPAATPAEAGERRAAPNAGLGLDAAIFASAGAVSSSSGALFGGGVSLDVVLRGAVLHPSLWLSAAIAESFDTQSPALVLETNVASFRAVPSAQLLQVGVLQVDLGAGMGLDLFHTIPRDAARPTVQLEPASTLADPIVEGLLVTRFRIARGARLLVGLALDYDFKEHRYTSVDRFDNPSAVLQPWAVRPSAMLGLCIPVFGASACASAE